MDFKEDENKSDGNLIICPIVEFLDILNEYRYMFKTNSQDDFLDFLRDNLSDFYLNHLKQCEFYSKSMNFYKNKIVLVEKKDDLKFVELHSALMQTICIHNKWLIDLVKTQPFFVDLTDHDFAQIIFQSQVVAFGFKMTEFRDESESYSVFDQNLHFNKDKMGITYGYDITNVSLRIQYNMNQLKLTPRERGLLLVFILCNCNGELFLNKKILKNFFLSKFFILMPYKENKIENKKLYNKMREAYSSALIKEFISNKRDSEFFQKLNNVSI